MKKLKEYFNGKEGKFKDASAEIKKKIKRLCWIAKKFSAQQFASHEEWENLCKEINEILQSDERGNVGLVVYEIMAALPTVRFVLFHDFILLPNGITLEIGWGRTTLFHTKEKALEALSEQERCDEEYLVDHWDARRAPTYYSYGKTEE